MNERQAGFTSGLVITAVLLGVLLVIMSGFAAWSFIQYLDYKDNVDPKVAAAVKTAKEEQATADQAAFDEERKVPTRKLVGPEDLGGVTLSFPRTWSVYVAKSGEDGNFEAYLHPGSVPSLEGNTPYALRVSVLNKSYHDTLDDFSPDVQEGKLRSSTVEAAGERGVRLDGVLEEGVVGSMVIFKVRDKSLLVFTESPDYRADFNKFVLPSLKFNR